MDEGLRECYRRYKETGAPEDQAAWLRERLREGELAEVNVRLAARLGEEGAILALGEPSESVSTVQGALADLFTSPALDRALQVELGGELAARGLGAFEAQSRSGFGRECLALAWSWSAEGPPAAETRERLADLGRVAVPLEDLPLDDEPEGEGRTARAAYACTAFGALLELLEGPGSAHLPMAATLASPEPSVERSWQRQHAVKRLLGLSEAAPAPPPPTLEQQRHDAELASQTLPEMEIDWGQLHQILLEVTPVSRWSLVWVGLASLFMAWIASGVWRWLFVVLTPLAPILLARRSWLAGVALGVISGGLGALGWDALSQGGLTPQSVGVAALCVAAAWWTWTRQREWEVLH